ncbi:MAG: hypothetical protein AMXMBFR33_12490 [Candidatus Xenobia bacterium]
MGEVFARHPAVCDIGELRFLIDPDGLLDFLQALEGWSPFHYDCRLKRLRAVLLSAGRAPLLDKILLRASRLGPLRRLPFKITPRYSGVSASVYLPGYFQLVDDLLGRLSSFSFPGGWVGQPLLEPQRMFYGRPQPAEVASLLQTFMGDFIDGVLARQNATCYLEKNTWNILWFDRILQILPESKLVHIVRDPRDVIASFKQQSWMPDTAEKCARVLNDLLDRWQEIKARVPAERVLEIRLEDLICERERATAEVCRFWELEPHPGLYDVKLSQRQIGRWQKDLTRIEADIANELTARIRERYGYS